MTKFERRKTMRRWATGLLVAGLSIGCGKADSGVATAAPQEDEAALVAHGRQLVQIGGCGDCHTPMRFDPARGGPVPELERALSGHPENAPAPEGAPGASDQAVIGATFTSFRTGFGVVYAANLTPDAQTGLGGWTVDEFIRSMRSGRHRGRADARTVLPPMPWTNLATQTDDDLRAIFAYLRSVPAVRNRVPEPLVPPPAMEAIGRQNDATARSLAM